MTAFLTLAESEDGRQLTKEWSPYGLPAPARMPFKCRYFTVPIKDLREVYSWLEKLADRPSICLIRGTLKPELDTTAYHRRLSVGLEATINDTPNTILYGDWDELITEPIGEAAVRARLPAFARNAAVVVQLSASTGHPGVQGWKFHWWVMLDRALNSDEARALMKQHGAGHDWSIYAPVNPFFVADPVMLFNMVDPLKGHRLAFYGGGLAVVPDFEMRTLEVVRDAAEMNEHEREAMKPWVDERIKRMFAEVPADNAGDYFRNRLLPVAPVMSHEQKEEVLTHIAGLGRSKHALRSAERALTVLEVTADNHALRELKQYRERATLAAQQGEFAGSTPGLDAWAKIKAGKGTKEDFKVVEDTIYMAVNVLAGLRKSTQDFSDFKDPENSLDLRDREVPQIPDRIDDLAPAVGAVLFAGKPKAGKSLIAMDIATSVATGAPFMGKRTLSAGVVCMMFEDTAASIKKRMDQTKLMQKLTPWASKLEWFYGPDRLPPLEADASKGLLALIDEMVKRDPNRKVFIIDTLQRAQSGVGDTRANLYKADVHLMGTIHSFALARGILIIALHHVKKGKVEDDVDSYSGSLGNIGSFDGGWVLDVDRKANTGQIRTQMRGAPSLEIDISREEGGMVWSPVEGNAEDGSASCDTKLLHILIAANCCLSPADLAARSAMPYNTCAGVARRMLSKNLITQPHRGVYAAPGITRERVEGIKDKIKNALPKKVDFETVMIRTGGKGAPNNAKYWLPLEDAEAYIGDGFAKPDDCLKLLKYRGIAEVRGDTVWLLGDEWGTKNEPVFKYPWEK